MLAESDKLVAMAHQIASFFRAYPEADAIVGVRDHIVQFWTPGMRRSLDARIASGAEGIDPLVVKAMGDQAKPGTSPIKKEVAGPGTLGQLASDAG